MQVIKKQRDELVNSQGQKKVENGRLQARIESLQKDINLLRIQIKNEETKKHARLEAAHLSLLIADGALPDYERLGMGLNGNDSTKQDVEEFMNQLNIKMKRLQQKEDEFNRNAAMVPESDPNVTLINDKIQEIKENVERISNERTQLMVEYKQASDSRAQQFLGFFDEVKVQVEQIYQALTLK